MGTKLAKSLNQQEEQQHHNAGQDWPEGSSKTSTLPASFRRKAHNLSKTGSLPRNSAGPDKTFDRNTTFGQRLRKSCRNWAKQKGLVSSSKENGKLPAEKSTKDEAETEAATPSVAASSVEPDNDKEQDIGSIVASLVVEAHKKKMASRAQSRAQSRELLLENPPAETQPAEKEQVEVVGEVGEGESCEKKEEESCATVTAEETKEDHTTSGQEPQVGGDDDEDIGRDQHLGKQSGEEEEEEEEEEDNRSESDDDKLIVGGVDNTDKSDSEQDESQHENVDDRGDNVDIKCQDNHNQNADEEKSENCEEEAGDATAVLELQSDQPEGNEVNGCKNTETEPESSAEEIDKNGSDTEELCEAQTVSSSGEDSQDSSDDSESVSPEKQVGEIIYDIVESFTSDGVEESDPVADKLER